MRKRIQLAVNEATRPVVERKRVQHSSELINVEANSSSYQANKNSSQLELSLHSETREREDPPSKGVSLPRGFSGEKVNKEIDVNSVNNENVVQQLLDLANKLPAKQRDELLDNLALQQQVSKRNNDSPDLDMWSIAVETALHEAIGGSDGGSYGALLIKRLLGAKNCWRPVEKFMETSKLNKLMRVERQAVYLLLARLLVDHAGHVSRRSGAPLSAKLVSNTTGNLPGVFEQAFPGYLAAGLARMVALRPVVNHDRQH